MVSFMVIVVIGSSLSNPETTKSTKKHDGMSLTSKLMRQPVYATGVSLLLCGRSLLVFIPFVSSVSFVVNISG